MDVLYAAVIGDSLQLIDSSKLGSTFWFSLFLIVVILEDFALYYADVAPDNPAHTGVSFFGMLSEIAILTTWLFCFQSFVDDKAGIFLLYLGLFFLLKSLAGFLNCLALKCLVSLKFLRELVFLATTSTVAWIYLYQGPTICYQRPIFLALIVGVWIAQTLTWWGMTKFVRRREEAEGTSTGTIRVASGPLA